MVGTERMTSPDLLPVSRAEMIAEVKREIEFRRQLPTKSRSM